MLAPQVEGAHEPAKEALLPFVLLSSDAHMHARAVPLICSVHTSPCCQARHGLSHQAQASRHSVFVHLEAQQSIRPVHTQVGAGYWLTDEALLRSKAEQLAKDQFAARRDPADAALQYMALGRRSLLQVTWPTLVLHFKDKQADTGQQAIGKEIHDVFAGQGPFCGQTEPS